MTQCQSTVAEGTGEVSERCRRGGGVGTGDRCRAVGLYC